MLLFDDIDQPGLNTLDGLPARARRLRDAHARARHGARRTCSPQLQASGLRGRGGAGFAMGTKASFLPKGDMDKYVVCNADESEPGTFKDRELMQKNPHLLIEGICDRRARGRREQGVHLHPRRVRPTRPTILEAALDGGQGRRTLLGDARPVGPPRRRRLHLRRGDGAARRARGQARQPAPEAAVPGRPGPLPRADADQQRRDADERPAHPADGRRGVRQDRHRALDGHEGRLGLGLRAAPGQLRDRARHPVARDHLRPRRRARRGALDQVLVPRRLERAGAARHRRVPRPALRLRLDGQGRLDARLGRDHRRRRLDPGRRRRAQDGEVLPPRVLRQVHAVPRGHELDREDARAHRLRRGHADGPRHHGLGLRPDHGQLPVRARRRDGDADRAR